MFLGVFIPENKKKQQQTGKDASSIIGVVSSKSFSTSPLLFFGRAIRNTYFSYHTSIVHFHGFIRVLFSSKLFIREKHKRSKLLTGRMMMLMKQHFLDYKQEMYRKWGHLYLNHLNHMFSFMRSKTIMEIEFEIYYTTNHNHEIEYVNDLLSCKSKL